MNSTVSIIIPTFNEEDYLPALLSSIEHQTSKPKEVIIVDAYSKDKTASVAKQYQFVQLFKKKGGPAMQRNFGAKQSSGEILLFLDADVVLPFTFLEDSLKEIRTRKLDIASCFIEPLSIRKRDKVLHKLVNLYLSVTESFFLHAPGFCIFVSKDLHNEVKGFDDKLFLGEDHDYVQRIARRSKFSYLHSHKIPVSVRRLKEEGRWSVTKKYIAIELYLFFLGKIKEPIYEHKFGEHGK